MYRVTAMAGISGMVHLLLYFKMRACLQIVIIFIITSIGFKKIERSLVAMVIQVTTY